jgi:predicted transcriptional regulator
VEDFLIGKKNGVLINFSKKYCTSSTELLESVDFKKILELYLKKISKKDTDVYKHLSKQFGKKHELTNNLIHFLKLLVVFDLNDAAKYYSECLITKKDLLLAFIEDFYDFWRSFERYAMIVNKHKAAFQQSNFFYALDDFNNLILSTYRKIEETLMLSKNKVYRQLNAGINVGMIVEKINWRVPIEYEELLKIPFIKMVVLQPPFFVYTKQNTRKGMFQEISENPLCGLEFNAGEWLCYPIKIGSLLAFVYFHSDFMAQGITLSNLFELATEAECRERKPDLMVIFGAKDGVATPRCSFYRDRKNDLIIGYLNHNEGIDYFGYMKKMILTVFNLKMIELGNLPIHGAMVNITLKSGKALNVVLMGDSGAGKSESLEAFRILAEEYVKEMKVIFDDMGYLTLRNGKVCGYGTEIGAFVRLDDLSKDYAYKAMERSIFLNPDRINARVVMPISTFEIVNAGYPVDYFLYANNYEDHQELEFFNSQDDAKKIFVAGTRIAKGTTNEVGIVHSYFANPFGPAQMQESTDQLIDKYFSEMFNGNVVLGQIRTRLGIAGFEQEGPLMAAKKLLDLFLGLVVRRGI